MSQRVFISSTCHDLIDLRAEIEVFFRESGLVPILSDIALSEFQSPPNLHSMETCLCNVRSCDLFVMVLSRRYGPRLGHRGFGNVSAAHLEFREALHQKKPIYLYIRDRLAADYANWRRSLVEPYRPVWLEGKDYGLFEILNEYNNLPSDAACNRIVEFRNSVELKQQLAIDFKTSKINEAPQ